jgi:hypothetical protein
VWPRLEARQVFGETVDPFEIGRDLRAGPLKFE